MAGVMAWISCCGLTDIVNCNVIKEKLDNSPAGIYLLNKRNQISCVKKPEKYTKELNAVEVFKVMHRNEFEMLLLRM
jgi:hypothetical protein